MTLVMGSGLVKKNLQGHRGKMSASFPLRGSIFWAVMCCLRKDWMTQTILERARQQSVNLYNSSESWNHRLSELKMTFGVIKFNPHVVEIETLERCIEDHTARKCNFRCPWDGSIIHIYYCNTKARVFKETCFISGIIGYLLLVP